MASTPAGRAADNVRAVVEGTESQANSGDLVVASRSAPKVRGEHIDPVLFGEVGTTGLRQYGGFVLEEWLTQLQGRRAAWVWREMMDNSPIVGAILFAIEWLARGVNWGVEVGGDPRAAELVESCMNDMGEHAWGDVISEALSMVPYGWNLSEVTYKRRDGFHSEESLGLQLDSMADSGSATQETTGDTPGSSDFTDGMIGWRKISQRAQETLLRWHFDGYSGLQAMEQIDWHGGSHTIPLAKSLLFRVRPRRGNPEGYSLLRTGYTSYYNLKRIQQIEAIGIERDLAGIPMITPPEGVDLFAPGYAALLSKVQRMVQSIRRDEYEGLVMPGYGWEFKLVSAGGSRQIATDPVIRRYEQRLATSMLADFVMIGQDSVGSYAMVDVKSEMFGMALDALLDLVCDVFNRQEIPRLLRLNGMDASKPPKIRHSSAGRIDLQKVGQFLETLAMAGAPIPWSDELLTSLFQEAALPTDFGDQKPIVLPEKMQTPQRTVIGNPNPAMPTADPAKPAENPLAPATEPVPAAGTESSSQAVQKAELDKVPEGTVVEMGPAFRTRHAVLSAMLEREIQSALKHLGEQAGTAYESNVSKASAADVKRLVAMVMSKLNLTAWLQRLRPILSNHAGRVEADTLRTIRSEIGREVHIGEQDAARISATAGEGLTARDIAPQVRDAITRAITEGLQNQMDSAAVARLVREYVPAGTFTHAGANYRSRVIARDQTARLQRASALAAYRSAPDITHVRVSDGILADSDADCRARDGRVVPIGEAGGIQQLHPNCTLSLSPVISGN